MATGNPGNIGGLDELLQSLGVGTEQPRQQTQTQAPKNLEVRVMFARSDGLYPVIVHLIVLDRGVTANDLEGRLLKGQWTFQAKSLKEFCDFYEFTIFELAGKEYHPENGIRYHRDPQQSMPIPDNQNVVNYGLVPRLEDPRGVQLLRMVVTATADARANYEA